MTLIRALARAHQWRKMLLSGEATSIEDLARRFGMDRGHVGLTLNLAFLSPTPTRAIVRGEQPPVCGSIVSFAMGYPSRGESRN